MVFAYTHFHMQFNFLVMQMGDRIKSPRQKSPGKNPPEKIPLNAVEREPVETSVLNPNASEVSYKPKQRSYRKTNLKKKSSGAR